MYKLIFLLACSISLTICVSANDTNANNKSRAFIVARNYTKLIKYSLKNKKQSIQFNTITTYPEYKSKLLAKYNMDNESFSECERNGIKTTTFWPVYFSPPMTYADGDLTVIVDARAYKVICTIPGDHLIIYKEFDNGYYLTALGSLDNMKFIKMKGLPTDPHIEPKVYSAGWDDKFVILKQHPVENNKITNYYIFSLVDNTLYGPYTKDKFYEMKKQLLVKPSLRFSISLGRR